MAVIRLASYWSHKRICALAICLIVLLAYWLYGKRVEMDYTAILKKANYSNLNMNYHVSKLISDFRCHEKPIKLLILVTSHVESFERRESIRLTWGRDIYSYTTDDFRTFFVVGKSHNENTSLKLTKEIETYKDIISGDFYETFYNLPYKFETIFEWAYKYCDFEFLLKTDDDVFINLSRVFELLLSDSTPKTQLYTGRAQFYAPVLREGKYAVTYEEYRSKSYPPFVGGGAVIFSQDVVKSVIPYFYDPPYKLDDIYVAILVANTGVTAIHQKTFLTTEPYCYYDDSAIALHFHKQWRTWTWWKNTTICIRELFYKMLAHNIEDEFTYSHYITRKVVI